jgi:threonine dehydratase
MTGPDFEALRAAHRRIAPHVHRTPVATCASLDAIAGARLHFKCENLQKTGSFKIRGATNAVFSLTDEEAARGVVTHSSGNHAAALSLAARRRGIPAYVVMPRGAPGPKRAAVLAYGGRITECEPALASREETARAVAERTGAAPVHPYDDPRIIAGQGTAAIELLEDVPDLDLVVAPVGGGGLMSGTAIAARSLRPGARLVGCEPEQADDAHRSLAAGRRIPIADPETVADGLRASLGTLTFAVLRERGVEIALAAEEEIVWAMRQVWERMKLVVEPSSAVAVAPVLSRRVGAGDLKVGILLSGGNVDLDHLPF